MLRPAKQCPANRWIRVACIESPTWAAMWTSQNVLLPNNSSLARRCGGGPDTIARLGPMTTLWMESVGRHKQEIKNLVGADL